VRAPALAGLLGCVAFVACGQGEVRVGGVVTPAVAVGAPGYAVTGMAVGEDGVWLGGFDRHGGVVHRLDRRSGRPVATVRLPHGGGDVAVGAGGVWTAGAVCVGRHPEDPEDVCLTEPRVSRIDPESGRVIATIRIPLPPGVGRDTALPSTVAWGAGALWAAVSWNYRTGEVLRIDPRTNEIAARIPTGGYVGELRFGAGSVWVLRHREYSDETRVKGASLLRIDPATGAVVAEPVRDELTHLGGEVIPPVLAAGDSGVWITSPTTAHPHRAIRVDTHTNRVVREDLRVERFYPVAVEDDAIWFIGSTGRAATLARLDPHTLAQTAVITLPILAVRAVHDPSTNGFWIASPVNRFDDRARVAHVRPGP
jgi:hypothetical protein